MFVIVSNNLEGYRPKSPEREAAGSMQDMSEKFVSKIGECQERGGPVLRNERKYNS